MSTTVSVIIPVYNAREYLDECFCSLLQQSYSNISVEISVYDDHSNDGSDKLCISWISKFREANISMYFERGTQRLGPGNARNVAIKNASGRFLMTQDADDISLPTRIQKQVAACLTRPNTIVGSMFTRNPLDATSRMTRWANSLTQDQLITQQFRECPVIHPTWMMDRETFLKVGGYDEGGAGTPEDMLFLYRHLKLGGHLYRVDEVLVVYRYHPTATSFSVHRDVIFELRVRHFEYMVLEKMAGWETFTIWNAGKEGRQLYKTLSSVHRSKVIAFCDVDPKKIANGVFDVESRRHIPVIKWTDAKPPIVTCVKYQLTENSQFEKNLESLRLVEGRDFFFFS